MSGKFYSFSVVLIWLNISLSSCEQPKDDAECFVPGECLDSTVLVVLQDSTVNDCLTDCKEYVADGSRGIEARWIEARGTEARGTEAMGD